MSQRTLVLLKPDAVRRGLTGEIISRIERKAGWEITALELRTLDQDTLEQHYGEHKGKPFYEPLVAFMASGPVVALVVEGERVIEGVRALAGPTDPIAAAPGSIRGDFGVIVRENLIHASDSEESSERELKIFSRASPDRCPTDRRTDGPRTDAPRGPRHSRADGWRTGRDERPGRHVRARQGRRPGPARSGRPTRAPVVQPVPTHLPYREPAPPRIF